MRPLVLKFPLLGRRKALVILNGLFESCATFADDYDTQGLFVESCHPLVQWLFRPVQTYLLKNNKVIWTLLGSFMQALPDQSLPNFVLTSTPQGGEIFYFPQHWKTSFKPFFETQWTMFNRKDFASSFNSTLASVQRFDFSSCSMKIENPWNASLRSRTLFQGLS